MNAEELGFFNRQLAGMLRAGIPLEGSLRKLCETMPESKMRSELQALEADLATGTPLADALKKRELPEMYVRMLTAGAASGDLPGVLIQFADYCEQRHSLSRRLRGMMTYPLIVLSISFLVSIFMASIFQTLIENYKELFEGFNSYFWSSGGLRLLLWLVPFVIGSIWILYLVLAIVPAVRRKWQWHLPGMKETCLAQLASLMELQLRSGISLGDAIRTAELMEADTPAARELHAWGLHLQKGGGSIPEQSLANQSIPPLFRWLVRQSGDDIGDGFAEAAKFYLGRSAYRSETFVHAGLPVLALSLGVVIIGQFFPVFAVIMRMLNQAVNVDG